VLLRSPGGVNEKIEHPQQHLAEALLCPLTLTMMEDPVMAMDGVTYEREAIRAFFRHERSQGRMPRSPLSRQTIASEQLLPNRTLKAVIDAYKCMPSLQEQQNTKPLLAPTLQRSNSSMSRLDASASRSAISTAPGSRASRGTSVVGAEPGLTRAGSAGSVLVRGGSVGSMLVRQNTSRSVKFSAEMVAPRRSFSDGATVPYPAASIHAPPPQKKAQPPAVDISAGDPAGASVVDAAPHHGFAGGPLSPPPLLPPATCSSASASASASAAGDDSSQTPPAVKKGKSSRLFSLFARKPPPSA
jgi:hypothetical protein